MFDQHTFVAGMDFDKYGVLWYSTMSFRVQEDEHYKAPSGLYRWDFLNGKEPEFLGIFGTPERVQTYTDSLFVDKNTDILYSASTNHSYGSPDVIAIDLKVFRKHMYKKGEICKDGLVYYPGQEEFKEFGDHWQNVKELIAEYAANLKAKKIQPVRLWREFSNTDISNAAVKGIKFIDNDTVEGICGNNELFKFTIKNGELVSVVKANKEDVKAILKAEPTQIENMPHYPGRQWRSQVSCECEWTNGSRLVGTVDGFLAKVESDGTVFSIGPAICQGPVRDICSDIKNGVAFGVGGDVEDVGNIFEFTDKTGLKYLGYMSCDLPNDNVGVCANFVLSSCAVSPDGTKIAIGASDRLACVYVCTIK